MHVCIQPQLAGSTTVTEPRGTQEPRTTDKDEPEVASTDPISPPACPECKTPFPPPRVQTLQQMGHEAVRRLRFECRACGHAISEP